MMDAEQLYVALKESQEKKGYLFNPNRQHTMEVLAGLLKNKERYGYMACPCRLASGEYTADRDILCPCLYREADVKEYNSCYCTLYVSREYDESNKIVVPERRPPEKMIF